MSKEQIFYIEPSNLKELLKLIERGGNGCHYFETIGFYNKDQDNKRIKIIIPTQKGEK